MQNETPKPTDRIQDARLDDAAVLSFTLELVRSRLYSLRREALNDDMPELSEELSGIIGIIEAGNRVPIADTPTRNSEALSSLADYCREHPSQRFWQALRNWSRFDSIIGETGHDPKTKISVDTFRLEGIDGCREAGRPIADTPDPKGKL